MTRPRSELILVLAALFVLGVALARQWQATGNLASVPLDDAYIHYRFADNLAHGRGFAFNPNEPTPGSTSPLWVLLLAGGELAGINPILASKILGALAFVACAWLTWRCTLRLMGDQTHANLLAIVAGALVALSGRMAWAALSGMETLAFAALALLAVYRLLNHPLDVRTSALLGLAALLRPEGCLLFAFLFLLSLLNMRGSPREADIRHSLLNVLAFAVIIAPYVIFSLATTGTPLPNTFRANARELSTLGYLVRYVRYVVNDNAVVFVLAVLGAIAAWQNRRTFHEWSVVLWAVGFPLVAAFVTPNLRHHGRYSIPLIPFNILLGMIGLREYIGRINESLVHRSSVVLSAAAIMLGLLSTWQWTGTYAADARDITQMQVAMAHWIDENTPRDATLALSDIGAITYFSNRRMIDIVGLVTPDILPAVSGKPVGLERDQAVFDYLARHRPDVVVIIPTWYPYLASSPGSHLMELHTVQLDHTPSVGGGDHLRAYRADWSWLNPPPPQNAVSAKFGQAIQLDGFDLAPGATLQAGSALTVTLHWRSLETAGRFKVFVHLLDASGKIAAQNDSEPVSNLWPTNLWRAGDVIGDDHPVALPADLAAGQYSIETGLYDGKTGTRLTLASGGDIVMLGTIEVTR